MKNKLLLLLVQIGICSGLSFAQQIVNHHATFNSGQQNMWGPSFSPVTLDQTITLFDQPWNVNWDTGSAGIFTIAGFDFGGSLSGSFSGVIGSEIRIEGFTTGTVEVDYPVDIELDMPTDLTYDQGDQVTVQTSYTVDPGWDMETLYPSAGEFFWDFYFRMAASASAQLCFFGCTSFPIIPAFDTGLQTINLVTISGSGASTGGTTGIWFLGPVDYTSPIGGHPVPNGSVWPAAYDPDFSASGLPGYAHIGAFPASLPDTDFGLSGEITIPYVETTPYLSGTDISACGDSTYFNLNLEVFKLLGKILDYTPPPGPAIGLVLSNLSGSQSIGGVAEVTWNFFSASFDANIHNKQCFDFTPTVYGQFQFPVAVDYTVTDGGGATVSSGQSSIINMEIGNDLNYKFPCYFEELDITPTYTIDGTFRNHTYDSVSFDFLMSAFEFGFNVPAVVVIPGFTIPEICVPIPYPCPSWSCPWCWCTSTVCTPEIVVPDIGFGGWSLSVGPLWSTSIPIGSFSYDWFDETWSLEGFTPQTFPPFTMIASPLTVSTSFTDVNCNGGNDGSIDVAISAVSDALPYVYTWTNGTVWPAGTANETLGTLTAGSYEASIIDANGCQLFNGATISEPQLLELDYSKIDKSCGGGVDNGSIDIDVIGGTAPYSYSWNTGATVQDIAGLAAGTYTLTVTDARGCVEVIAVDISEPGVLGQTGIVTDVNCFGGSDGSIAVSTFGGTLPYVYSWSSGQNSEDISGITGGPYLLTITDGKGCSSIANYIVAEPPTAVSVTTIGTDVLCHSGISGAVDATVGGGSPGYTFIWSSVQSGVLPYTTEDITNIPAGTYTILATDTRGCQAQASQIVGEPGGPLAANEVVIDVLCFGAATGSIDPVISGGTPIYNYLWSTGATSATLNALIAGTYDLTVTDQNGCTDSWSWVVKEPLAPLAVSVEGVDILCHGGTNGEVNSTVTGGTEPYSYLWNTGATSANIATLPAGPYDVTVTDNHGCVALANIVLIEPAAALALSATHVDVDCHGNNTGSVDLTVVGGTGPYSQMWSNSSSVIMTDTTQDLTNMYTDLYTVLVTDANGCQETLTETVNEPSAPLAITGIIDDANCFGLNDGAVDATVTGGTLAYAYSWDNGAITEDISGVLAGPYILTVTDLNGCVAIKDFTIEQPIAPLLVNTFPTDVLCNGGSTGAAESEVTGGTAPYQYLWSNGATSTEIINVLAGIYTVTITDAQGCTAFSGTTVNEPAALVVTPTITDASCYNYADGEVVLTVTGGVQPYYFNWGNQNEILLNNPSETLSNLEAADYFLRVRDANGCIHEQIVTVGEPLPFVATNVVTDASCYGSADGAIDVTITGGTLPYSSAWSDGQSTEDAVNLVAGIYTYTVTDGMGCMIVDSAEVDQPDMIQITYDMVPVSCVDQSDAAIYITPYGGTMPYSYLWSTGSTDQNAEGLAPGTYDVTVTDANTCTQTFGFEIFLNDVECLIIPNTFTPNGDQYNDTWVIGNIDLYPNAEVHIFNKWGNELYSTSGTYTPWDGIENGNPLPSDVYYYIILLNNGDDNKYTGNVIIVR